MLRTTVFNPRYQFHLLINFKQKDERSIAILPNRSGQFRVVDQGDILGELEYDQHCNCIASRCNVPKHILAQIKNGIRDFLMNSFIHPLSLT